MVGQWHGVGVMQVESLGMLCERLYAGTEVGAGMWLPILSALPFAL